MEEILVLLGCQIMGDLTDEDGVETVHAQVGGEKIGGKKCRLGRVSHPSGKMRSDLQNVRRVETGHMHVGRSLGEGKTFDGTPTGQVENPKWVGVIPAAYHISKLFGMRQVL